MTKPAEVQMGRDQLIQEVAEYVRQKFSGEGSGHDWWHMYRVWQLAKTIASQEAGANVFVAELGALLHDFTDAKLSEDQAAGRQEVLDLLGRLGIDDATTQQVLDSMVDTSFSSSLVKPVPSQELSIEAQIISDADKLDAIGAIGIARAFAYGGHKARMIYDPDRAPEEYKSAEEYHANDTPTINHFYEKLLLLKDRMYTKTAKQLAEQRHRYMEEFLKEFYAEWDGER